MSGKAGENEKGEYILMGGLQELQRDIWGQLARKIVNAKF